MAILYVRTHWTDLPPSGSSQLQPAPSWAASYPGTLPLQPFGPGPAGGPAVPPTWSTATKGPVTRGDEYTVWFPVVAHADLQSSGWAAGSGWAGAPPPHWDSSSGAPAGVSDMGYGSGATGFGVRRVRLYVQKGQGGDFSFTVRAPSGAVIGTATTSQVDGWTPWLTVPASVADGRGIWSVVIDRTAASSVSAPSLLPAGGSQQNAVAEPYVSPYNNVFEGILGVAVDGDELTTTVPPAVSLTATPGACDASGRRAVSLDAVFTPPLPSGWSYSVTWTTALPPPPPPPATGTVGPTALPSVTTVVPYPPGTHYPSATVVLTPPGGVPTSQVLYVASLAVPTCPTDVDCPELTLAASRTGVCVDASGASGAVTFTARVTSGGQPVAWSGAYSWTVRDSAGQQVGVPSPVPTGDTLTMSFTRPDRYVVTAAIVRDPACEPPILTASVVLDVGACGCPSIAGGITASRVDGCTFDFAATVVASGASGLTYLWDFGDGTTSTSPPPTRHVYGAGSGARTVTLTVTGADGCQASATTTVTLDCGGDTRCPELASGITVTPVPGAPCTFDLAAPVTGGAAGSQVTWTLPGGTVTGPTARTTIPAGSTQTVTATLTSPGCPDRAASTTLTCPGDGDGDGDGGATGCAILLVIALALMAIGTVLAVIGACASNPYVGVAGGIVVAVGLVLFIIWALACASQTPCPLMRVVHCVIFVFVGVVLPILVLLLGLFGGLPCALAGAVGWGYWGAMLAWLGFIMRRVGCAPTC